MDSIRCADPGCRSLIPNSSDRCGKCSLPKDKSVQYYSNKRGFGGRGNRGGGRHNDRSSRGGGFGNRGRRDDQAKDRPVDQGIDTNNPTIAPFVEFARYLDTRNDKHERIFKLSRDIVIESKRAIFFLHRIQGENEEILRDAKRKLDDIRFKLWFYVAEELQQGDQPYQFLRAYKGGLEEYIEAYSFYHYIKTGELVTWSEMQENLTFRVKPRRESAKGEKRPETSGESTTCDEQKPDEERHIVTDESDEKPEKELSEPEAEKKAKPEVETTETLVSNETKAATDLQNELTEKDSEDSADVNTPAEVEKETWVVLIPKMDYLFGIADLTGEMMRQAISSAGNGNTNNCFSIFTSLQNIHSSFNLLCRDGQRDLSRKLSVLEASLKKVEAVCYNINVRSTEIPKHLIGTYMALREATSYNDNRKPQIENENEESFD